MASKGHEAFIDVLSAFNPPKYDPADVGVGLADMVLGSWQPNFDWLKERIRERFAREFPLSEVEVLRDYTTEDRVDVFVSRKLVAQTSLDFAGRVSEEKHFQGLLDALVGMVRRQMTIEEGSENVQELV